MQSDADARRAELLAALRRIGRENTNATVMLHSAIAERMGLGPTEEKTVDLLERLGPLTAGEIAERTGLAAASVTSLIDRLEEKGFARRVRDAKDRRRVIVELNRDRNAQFRHLFGALGDLLDELLAPYTNEQLELILDFLERATRRTHEEIARLRGTTEP